MVALVVSFFAIGMAAFLNYFKYKSTISGIVKSRVLVIGRDEKLEGRNVSLGLETAERVRTVMEESKKEIAPLLTPEQQKKLDKLESEHRKMMLHHGFLPPPKDKPPPPAP